MNELTRPRAEDAQSIDVHGFLFCSIHAEGDDLTKPQTVIRALGRAAT
jgi:hypothetical protein